ncbi:uncharacterized protein M2352_003280 [Azospirillum fermentarium]|uniref:pentapeptide repeat-containing protein n=1 Tax=Azospirillum fermentarium TaxID=1233114 RepID=UPI002226DBB9|nr:pentapeptide repeat-containing protein [Azospirillum fermentarium]MCW2247646.1 uncharacterized protein [Azospirillum fermentarium]
MLGTRGRTAARIGLLASGLAGLALPAWAASDSACGEMPKAGYITVSSPKEAGRLPADHPVVAWIGPALDQAVGGEPQPWPAAVLARMKLAPGSVVNSVGVTKDSLAGWQAPGVRFLDVSFAESNLAGTNFAGACFDHGVLTGADFSGANLSGARLESTTIAGVRFDRANLSGATIACPPGIVGEGCDGFEGEKPVSLRDADLRGTDLAAPLSTLDTVLDGARVERTVLPLMPDILDALAKAQVTDVRLTPPPLRSGNGEVFTAAELDQLRQLGGGKPLSLMTRMGTVPSFDCSPPNLSVVEKALCQMDDLAALDRVMGLTYRRVIDAAADKTLVKTAQTTFLKTRNGCATLGEDTRYSCIANAYVTRLAELGRETVKAASAPGTRRFSGGPAHPKAAVANDPLVARLVRAYGDSPDIATITGAGGTLTVTAEATGGNGHACGFEAPVRFDTVRGVWVGEVDGEKMAWVILPEGLVPASKPEESHYFCGMRAMWPAVYFQVP